MPSVQDMFDKYDTLTNKQKVIFDYLIANPEDICYIPLKLLSSRVNASEVSVLRLCKTLGFESYIELKEAFRKHTQQLVRSVNDDSIDLTGNSYDQSDPAEIFSHILSSERINFNELLMSASADAFFKCADLLLNAQEVFVFGHDVSKIMADYLVHRLNYLRIKAVSIPLGVTSSLTSIFSQLKADDVVVFFSFPPYHVPIYNMVRFAEHRGANVITITDSLKSPAVTKGSHNILCPTATSFFFNTLTAPISAISMLSSCCAVRMGDSLNEILIDEMSVGRFINGETNERNLD